MRNMLQLIKCLVSGWFTNRRKLCLPAGSENVPVHSEPHLVCAVDQEGKTDVLTVLESHLCEHYIFRFNRLTEVTEYHRKNHPGDFIALDKRELNGLCIQVRVQGINCWDRDVSRFVHSNRVAPYHPFAWWMERLPQWDGVDRVGPLSRRVSTNALWEDGFRRWLLGLAAQWMGVDDLHGNSVAPVLISRRQGQHKSTFCKLLMPKALQSYYTDHFDITAESGAVHKLASFGLINLDELDKYSERKMALLKNLMQMSGVNIRKAHQKGYSSLPRIASFIGTSNRSDLLTDPTGSRRFLCIEVQEKIDTSPVDHDQLYAQLKTELLQGERHWFTTEEEAAVIQHNAPYQRTGMDTDIFHTLFRVPFVGEQGEWLSASFLYQTIKKQNPSAMRDITTTHFGRTLISLGLERKHTSRGSMYKVIPMEIPETNGQPGQ